MKNENKTISGYQFNTQFCLGEGAFGKVYQGVNISNQQQVAVKIIDLRTLRDPYIKAQIMNEVNLHQTLSHPNIVQIYSIVQKEDFVYIITEFCKNGDIREMIHPNGMKEDEAIEIIQQIASGLKYLKQKNIIHRDLKPANILSNAGIYKIADFGFAKAIQPNQLMKSYVGSPYYMAPQLLAGQQYSDKCDIWSLAVICYELLFGQLPWIAPDQQKLYQEILKKPITTILKNKQISKQTQNFLERGLEVEEKYRAQWDEVFKILQSPLSTQIQSTVNMTDNLIPNSVLPKHRSKNLIFASKKTLFDITSIIEELLFKHYITTELLVNINQLFDYFQSNIVLLLICLNKEVQLKCQQLILDTDEQNKSLVQSTHLQFSQFNEDLENDLNNIYQSDNFIKQQLKKQCTVVELNQQIPSRINEIFQQALNLNEKPNKKILHLLDLLLIYQKGKSCKLLDQLDSFNFIQDEDTYMGKITSNIRAILISYQ